MRLEELYTLAWQSLSLGALERRHPFHAGYFGYWDGKYPRTATITLRKAHASEQELLFNVDARSPKAVAAQKYPHGSLLFYSVPDKLQIRLTGALEFHSQDEVSRSLWNEAPPLARRCYLLKDGPGSECAEGDSGFPDDVQFAEPTLERSEDGYPNFAVIKLLVDEMDVLSLCFTGHERAIFTQAGSRWVLP